MSKLPDFIIAGLPKCGTTSLHYALMSHPNISMLREEVHFFDHHWNQGINWYHDQFKDLTGVVGERTPAYSHQWHVHPLIRRFLPQVKIILAFRNPVDRTFSEWNMTSSVRKDNDFSKKIDIELSRSKESKMMRKGKYIKQIHRLLKFFPREQLHFVIAEQIDSQSELSKVQEFLRVPVIDLPPQHRNIGDYKGDTMEEPIREKLKEYFRPWNEQLFEFLGKEIPEWK